MHQPPATLGFTFPLNQKNIDEKWEELFTWMGRKAGTLKARTLTMAGRALLFKSLVLSKIWYTCMVAAPSPTMITRIQQMAWDFIWGGVKTHPAVAYALLPKSRGGINAPDVSIQVSTFAASIFQHAFNNPDKVWAKHLFKQQELSCKKRSFWNAMTIRTPSTQYGYHPKAALRAWKQINQNSPITITFPSYLSFKELKLLIKPTPEAAVPRFEPKTLDQDFNWNQVFNGDLPPKIQEILWRAAYNAQPNKSRLHHMYPAKFTSLCDMCIGHVETSEHMYAKCEKIKSFMDKVRLLTVTCKQRQKRYLMGIAYQAIWYAHTEARIAERAILEADVYGKYIGLLTYFKSRTQKTTLRVGWPSERDIAAHIIPP